MTANRDADRLIRAWLDLMPEQAPDRVIDSVLQATVAVPQVRRLPRMATWRPPMNRLTLIAAVAVLAAALAGGAYLIAGGPKGPIPTSSPSVAPTTAPSPTARSATVPVPATTWGDWLAEVPALPEIAMPEGLIQLSIDWDGGDRIWLQTTPDYRQLLSSTPMSSAAGEIRMRSDAVESVFCPTDSEGRYGWDRSADGMFLTLTLIEDECAARATVFARTWVHSHGAVNDGGRGINYAVTPMIEMVLPDRRWGMGTNTISTFDDGTPRDFMFLQEPQGFADGCATSLGSPIAIEQTLAGLVSNLQGLPGASVTSTDIELGGLRGVRLAVELDAGITCPAGEMTLLRPKDGLADGSSDLRREPAAGVALWVVEVDGHLLALLLAGDGVTLSDEQAVFETVKFLDELPTT